MFSTRIIMLFALSIVFITACGGSSDEPTMPPLIEQVQFEHPAMQKCFKDLIENDGWETIEEVTSFACSRNGIDTALGLEQLTNLKSLSLTYTAIKELDLSENRELNFLAINYNPYLNTLDLSNNLELHELYITNNSLKSINLSNLTELWVANLRTNMLTEVKATNTSLENLWLGGNLISSIDLTYVRDLRDLRLGGNSLTAIDLSNLPVLGYLELSDMAITSIDLSHNIELVALQLQNNKLLELNLDSNQKLSGVNLLGNPLNQFTRDYLSSIEWIENLKY